MHCISELWHHLCPAVAVYVQLYSCKMCIMLHPLGNALMPSRLSQAPASSTAKLSLGQQSLADLPKEDHAGQVCGQEDCVYAYTGSLTLLLPGKE